MASEGDPILAEARAVEASRIERFRRRYVLRHLAEALVWGYVLVMAAGAAPVLGFGRRFGPLQALGIGLSAGLGLGAMIAYWPVVISLFVMGVVRLVVCTRAVGRAVIEHDPFAFDRSIRHQPST